MEPSSDEEFGWTNTSNNESDTEPEMTFDGESESGKSYKKKLQNKLFQNGDRVSEEIRESQHTPRKKLKKPKRESSRSTSPSPTPRRVKRESLANGHDDSADDDSADDGSTAAEHLLKVKVKQERARLATPPDTPRKRRVSVADPEPDQEQPLKKKKKKDKKRDAAEHESDKCSTIEVVDKLDNGPAEGPADHAPEDRTEGPFVKCSNSPQKKKKKKQNTEGHSERGLESPKKEESSFEGHCKFEAEETIVQSRPKPNREPKPPKPKPEPKPEHDNEHKMYTSKEFVSDDSSSEDERSARAPERSRMSLSDAKSVESPRKVRLSERITFEDSSQSESGSNRVRKESHESQTTPRRPRISERIKFEDDSQSASELKVPRGKSQPEPSVPKVPNRLSLPEPVRPRISERITFEESQESGSERERTPPAAARADSGRLGRFLRAHAHMRPALGDFPPGAAVTAADDVWVVRCPRDLPVAALRGLALDPEFRSKLKVDGRAYEVAPHAADARLAVLAPAASGRGYCVRAVQVRGALRLRPRLPRTHAPHAAAAGEPERVPLPETRARHPLLGADYERAALPPDVRRRLAAAAARADTTDPDEIDNERREKKKKKKKHKEREPEPEPSVEREPKEKKRKRKHSTWLEPDPPGEPDPRGESARESPPRKKKVKKEKKRRDDAAVWDSERAIEESLFNF